MAVKKSIALPEIKAKENTVVVIGLPACGKSTIALGLLKKYDRFKYYCTDNYIKYEFKESLYKMMDDLRRDISPCKIIEGVQGYRLLRKGLELKTFSPDLVVICVADKATRQKRFLQREAKVTGTGKKRHGGFDGMLTKIWNDYTALLARTTMQKPRFVILDTVTGKMKHA
jgi:hypothetical protein